MTARLLGLLFSGFAVRVAGGLGAVIVATEIWGRLAPILAAVSHALPN